MNALTRETLVNSRQVQKMENDMNAKQIVSTAVLVAIGLLVCYSGKHIAHVKCVEGALEMRCKNLQGFTKVVSIDVPWWNPLSESDGYNCTAKLAFAQSEKDVEFVAKRVRIVGALEDVAKAYSGQDVADDWEVNMGFWGWIGDDYRIQGLKAK